MFTSLAIAAAAAEAEHHVELPMPSVMYGVVAMIAFLLMLVVLWSFASVSHRTPRHDARLDGHADGVHGPAGGHGQGGHAGH